MDNSAQFRILHKVSGRSIPETAEMLGEKNTRNVDNWVKDVNPKKQHILDMMQAEDYKENNWIRATVKAVTEFIGQMEEAQGVAPAYLTMSYYQNENDYLQSPQGFKQFHIPYRQYVARQARLYSVLTYLGYKIQFSYIHME